MTVQAARVQYVAGKRRLMPIGGTTAARPTDDLGQFRILNLPPGDYYLMALSWSVCRARTIPPASR